MSERGPGRPRATTREEIRSIAIDLFVSRGYGRTSLTQIAATAGISRTTLFSYFPAKRDLIWAELIERAATETAFASTRGKALVDLIADRIVELGRYPAADREGMAVRWRIVQEDEGLRAYGAVQSAELAQRIVAEALHREPASDPRLVDHVVRALIAVTTRCAEEWARGAGAGQDLDAYTSDQIAPIAVALRPLVP